MAEEENGATPPANDSDTSGENSTGTSSEANITDAEQARRQEQSDRDKANATPDDRDERLSSLEMREAERARDTYVNELVSDKEKYPNVDSNDSMFKFATSKEEVEEIANTLQNKYTDMQQNALNSVQSETNNYLTDEQIEKEEIKLEEDTSKNGKSNFGSFMDNLARRKR